VAAGGTLEAKPTVKRYWPDFKGKVALNGLNLPPGFSLPTTDIAADQDSALMKIKVAANVPPGDYSVVVRGDAQVPFAADAKASTRALVRVADPSTPMIITVTPAAKK
jgi:hypothetical protein